MVFDSVDDAATVLRQRTITIDDHQVTWAEARVPQREALAGERLRAATLIQARDAAAFQTELRHNVLTAVNPSLAADLQRLSRPSIPAMGAPAVAATLDRPANLSGHRRDRSPASRSDASDEAGDGAGAESLSPRRRPDKRPRETTPGRP